jgi:hypothetical protein
MIETFLLFVKGKALLLKMIGTASVIAVAVGSCMLRDASIRNEGATTKAAEIKELANAEGDKKAKRAAKAIDAARQPGSFDRLRADSRTCPDCNR